MRLYTTAMVGIEIDEKEYTKRKSGPAIWCSHMDVRESGAKFCSECGAKRPRKKTRSYKVVDWSKLPKPFVEKIMEGGGLDEEELEDFGPNPFKGM